MPITESELTFIIIVTIFLLLINVSRASYWKGKFESMDKERGDNTGWMEEARFLRRLVDKEAAEAIEETFS